MRKIFLLLAISLCSTSLFAETMEIQRFTSPNKAMIPAVFDTIQAVMNDYFRPAGYTQQDMGGFMSMGGNASTTLVVSGSHNFYYVYITEITVTNPTTNAIVAHTVLRYPNNEGFAVDIRKNLKPVLEAMSKELAIVPGQPKAGEVPPTILEGYLLVFPLNLGTYNGRPNDFIQKSNEQGYYGIRNWRLPSTDEMALMRANGLLRSDVNYITSQETCEGMVRLVADIRPVHRPAGIAATRVAGDVVYAKDGYVDLGYDGDYGRVWSDHNLFKHRAAMAVRYEDALPSKIHYESLRDLCRWIWKGNGYKVYGPNGNSIFLPAEGYRPAGKVIGSDREAGVQGYYWMDGVNLDGENAECFAFDEKGIRQGISHNIHEFLSVRKVASFEKVNTEEDMLPNAEARAKFQTIKHDSETPAELNNIVVFPYDLGEFEIEPLSVIGGLNSVSLYGHKDWRLPTAEELEAMRAAKLLGEGTYMTAGYNDQAIVRLVANK